MSTISALTKIDSNSMQQIAEQASLNAYYYLDYHGDFERLANIITTQKLNNDTLWSELQPLVQTLQDEHGVLFVKDILVENPLWSPANDETAIKADSMPAPPDTFNQTSKLLNVLLAAVHYNGVNIPIGFELVPRVEPFSMPVSADDEHTRFVRRRNMVRCEKFYGKSEAFKKLMRVIAAERPLYYGYVIPDTTLSSPANMRFIKDELGQDFIFPTRSDRLVAENIRDKRTGKFWPISDIDIDARKGRLLFMNGMDRPLKAVRQSEQRDSRQKYFQEPHILSNDLSLSPKQIMTIFGQQYKQASQDALNVYH